MQRSALSIGELGREALAGNQEPDHISKLLVAGLEATNISSGTHAAEECRMVLRSRNQGCLSWVPTAAPPVGNTGCVNVPIVSCSILINRVSI